MIFNRYCDRALWLILAANDKNRDVIINFIKDIPYELHEKIENSLDIFNEYEDNDVDIFDRDETVVSTELFVSNGYKYWVILDMFFGTLNIGRSFNDKPDIDITLYMSGKHNENDDQVLGYVYFDGAETCYEISNTLLGRMVVSFTSGKLKRCRRVDTEMIPDDIKIADLSTMNRLGRSRIRKRYY